MRNDWPALIAKHPPCRGCNGKVLPIGRESAVCYAKRQNCSQACADKCRTAANGEAAQRRWAAAIRPPPAGATADFGAGFGAHNIEPGDGGVFRTARPDSRTYGGVGSGWMA